MVADEFILLQSLLQEIIPGNLILSTGWVCRYTSTHLQLRMTCELGNNKDLVMLLLG